MNLDKILKDYYVVGAVLGGFIIAKLLDSGFLHHAAPCPADRVYFSVQDQRNECCNTPLSQAEGIFFCPNPRNPFDAPSSTARKPSIPSGSESSPKPLQAAPALPSDTVVLENA